MLRKCAFLLLTCLLSAAFPIQIEPQVLARVGDKALTSMDVKRRMDFIFQHQYPQYAKNEMARLEFYKNSWKGVLQDMIQTEMILAHVTLQEEKVKQKLISDGDVHRELHERFGPDVIASLSNIGMTYEEGCTMLRREMQVGNMIYISVQDKVKKRVRPEDIRARYERISSEMRNKKRWRYQVITIDSDSADDRTKITDLTQKILQREGLTALASLNDKAQTAASIQLVTADEKPPAFKVTVSSTIETGEDDITPERAAALQALHKGEWSAPITHTQRKSGREVNQILVLHSTLESKPPAFEKEQENLRMELSNEIYQEEMGKFVHMLEERFPVELLYTNSDEPYKLS